MNLKIKKEKETNYFIKIKPEDYILPSCIDLTNPLYLRMDEEYYSGLIVTNYSTIQEAGWIAPLFNLDFNIDISMFLEKLNSQKIIRELTYYIGDMGGAIKTVNSNQEDIDIIKKAYDDAKYIRHQMQVNKEELYNLYIYISVFSKDLEELNYQFIIKNTDSFLE